MRNMKKNKDLLIIGDGWGSILNCGLPRISRVSAGLWVGYPASPEAML